MKLIPEVSFSELLADRHVSGLLEYFKRKVPNFELLFNAGETGKIVQLLPSGQRAEFDKFLKLLQANLKVATKRAQRTPPKLEQERKAFHAEIENLRNDPLVLQAAEALRKNDREHYVPLFSPNSLSSRQLLLLVKAKETLEPSMPDIVAGQNFIKRQHKNGLRRWEENQDNHKQWQKWQSDEIASKPNFARQSKQEQAKHLKKKHSIPFATNTIAKRLKPLPHHQ